MVVTAQVHHVQEVVQVQRDGGAGGDLREVGVGELGADLGHGRMVTAGSDNTRLTSVRPNGFPYRRSAVEGFYGVWPRSKRAERAAR